MTDDRELWDRICRRDDNAFEELYRTYSVALQAFLRRVLSSQQAAEDVTQETFASIWRHPNGFDPARGTLHAYLFGAGRKRAAECVSLVVEPCLRLIVDSLVSEIADLTHMLRPVSSTVFPFVVAGAMGKWERRRQSRYISLQQACTRNRGRE